MKIKYEIETDGCTYTEKVTIDGKLINEQMHENCPGGSKLKSGSQWEDVLDSDLADILDSFIAFDLFIYANQRLDD